MLSVSVYLDYRPLIIPLGDAYHNSRFGLLAYFENNLT